MKFCRKYCWILLHGWKSTYWKLRRRGSFDFPVLSVAAAGAPSRENVIEDARIVVGAAACRPLPVHNAAKSLLAALNHRHRRSRRTRGSIAKPLDNTDFDMTWRKELPPNL